MSGLSYLWWSTHTGRWWPLWRRIPQPKLKPFYRQVLEAYLPYYRQLTPEERADFDHRVAYFIDANEFIARSMPRVEEEMKALIAGAAVQLTFGFKPMHLPHFQKIVLYPKPYFSRITRQYHQGEVNPRGLIVLAWNHFEEGFKDPRDGRNLALHELAHALRLENAIRNEEYGFIDKRALLHFDELALDEIERMHRGEGGLLRQYGASDLHEFFAVAVENFFERPRQMWEEVPEIYSCLKKVLRQDPLKR